MSSDQFPSISRSRRWVWASEGRTGGGVRRVEQELSDGSGGARVVDEMMNRVLNGCVWRGGTGGEGGGGLERRRWRGRGGVEIDWTWSARGSDMTRDDIEPVLRHFAVVRSRGRSGPTWRRRARELGGPDSTPRRATDGRRPHEKLQPTSTFRGVRLSVSTACQPLGVSSSRALTSGARARDLEGRGRRVWRREADDRCRARHFGRIVDVRGGRRGGWRTWPPGRARVRTARPATRPESTGDHRCRQLGDVDMTGEAQKQGARGGAADLEERRSGSASCAAFV